MDGDAARGSFPSESSPGDRRCSFARVVERSGFPPASHSRKDLEAILESYPRNELFQASTDELFRIAMGILHLQERQRVRLFVRRDTYGRFFSCLVFIPRDRYNTAIRLRMQDLLTEAFEGTAVEYTTRVSESVLARLHFIVRTEPNADPSYDVQEIEKRLVAAVRSWSDDLRAALVGYMFTGPWTALVSVSVIQSGLLHVAFGIVGLLLASLVLLGSMEFVGANEKKGWKFAAMLVPIAYVGWSLWLLALGIALLVTA